MYPMASSLDPLAPIKAAPTVALGRMDPLERARVRAAAFRATRIYPGPVGELISRELMIWDEMGWRIGSRGPTMTLVDHIEKAQLPTPAEPAA